MALRLSAPPSWVAVKHLSNFVSALFRDVVVVERLGHVAEFEAPASDRHWIGCEFAKADGEAIWIGVVSSAVVVNQHVLGQEICGGANSAGEDVSTSSEVPGEFACGSSPARGVVCLGE